MAVHEPCSFREYPPSQWFSRGCNVDTHSTVGPLQGLQGNTCSTTESAGASRDISAGGPGAPPPHLLLSPQGLQCCFSHFFPHPSLCLLTEAASAAHQHYQNLDTCTQYNYLLSKCLRTVLFKNIPYTLCIGSCD